MTIKCKFCGGSESIKNGITRGHQRYLCQSRECGRCFTDTPPRGKPASMKAMAVLDYGAGKQSYGMIAKKLNVSHVSVYRWVRKAAENIAVPTPPPPESDDEPSLLMLDEMHHSVNGKKNVIWIWRAICAVTGHIIGWHLGNRTDACLQQFLDWLGIKGRIFITDDWDGFHRLIPAQQLYTGKDLTMKIESSNSDVRHHTARFTRRCKVHSRSIDMIDLTLRLAAHLRITENYNKLRDLVLSTFR